MLVQDGKTGFMGFGGLSESMGNAFGYVPKSIGDEGDEHSIDSELRMLMRKMGKKDTITRLKVRRPSDADKYHNDLIKPPPLNKPPSYRAHLLSNKPPPSNKLP